MFFDVETEWGIYDFLGSFFRISESVCIFYNLFDILFEADLPTYRYFGNLQADLPPTSDTVYRHRGKSRGITPLEIHGLHAVLSVIRVVAEKVSFG